MDKSSTSCRYSHTNQGLKQTLLDKIPGIASKSNDVDSLMLKVLQDNDYMAFKVLFQQMYSPLCKFCFGLIHVREVAEELVSDVFYTIWKNRRHITVTSCEAYLFTSVRNRGFDHLRKIKHSICCDLKEASDLPTEVINSEELLIQEELNAHVEKSVAKLPKQCRLIFELSRDHGMKYKEISSLLNISVKTVETQMGRALKRLRESMAEI